MRTYIPHAEWKEECFVVAGEVRMCGAWQRMLQRIEELHKHVAADPATNADEEWANAMVGAADISWQWLEACRESKSVARAWELLCEFAAIFDRVVAATADHRRKAMLLKRWHTCRRVFVSYLSSQHVRESAITHVLRSYKNLLEGGLPHELLEIPTSFAVLTHTVLALGKLLETRAVYDRRSREYRDAKRAADLVGRLIAREQNPETRRAYFGDVYECFHEASHRWCTTRCRHVALESLACGAGVLVSTSRTCAHSAHKHSRRECV